MEARSETSRGSEGDLEEGPRGVFHLAIPARDLDAAERFYTTVLGARRARRYDDRVTLWFFGHQVVCHLDTEHVEVEPRPYPRHFGFTFTRREDFDRVWRCVEANGPGFLQERHVRWPEKPERHETFFVADPSNNVIEFKCYDDPRFVY